jgi:hypothetical protein
MNSNLGNNQEALISKEASTSYSRWLAKSLGGTPKNVTRPLYEEAMRRSGKVGRQAFRLVRGHTTPGKENLSISDFSVSIGAGLIVVKKNNMDIAAGIGMKVLSTAIKEYKTTYFLGSFGGIWKFQLKKSAISAGLSIEDLSTGQKMIEYTSYIPYGVRFGVRYNILLSLNHNISIMGEGLYKKFMKFGFGLEYGIYKMGFVRLGYNINSKQIIDSNFVFGIGVVFKNIKIDYAGKLLAVDDGLLHTVSLGMKF